MVNISQIVAIVNELSLQTTVGIGAIRNLKLLVKFISTGRMFSANRHCLKNRNWLLVEQQPSRE